MPSQNRGFQAAGHENQGQQNHNRWGRRRNNRGMQNNQPRRQDTQRNSQEGQRGRREQQRQQVQQEPSFHEQSLASQAPQASAGQSLPTTLPQQPLLPKLEIPLPASLQTPQVPGLVFPPIPLQEFSCEAFLEGKSRWLPGSHPVVRGWIAAGIASTLGLRAVAPAEILKATGHDITVEQWLASDDHYVFLESMKFFGDFLRQDQAIYMTWGKNVKLGLVPVEEMARDLLQRRAFKRAGIKAYQVRFEAALLQALREHEQDQVIIVDQDINPTPEKTTWCTHFPNCKWGRDCRLRHGVAGVNEERSYCEPFFTTGCSRCWKCNFRHAYTARAANEGYGIVQVDKDKWIMKFVPNDPATEKEERTDFLVGDPTECKWTYPRDYVARKRELDDIFSRPAMLDPKIGSIFDPEYVAALGEVEKVWGPTLEVEGVPQQFAKVVVNAYTRKAFGEHNDYNPLNFLPHLMTHEEAQAVMNGLDRSYRNDGFETLPRGKKRQTWSRSGSGDESPRPCKTPRVGPSPYDFEERVPEEMVPKSVNEIVVDDHDEAAAVLHQNLVAHGSTLISAANNPLVALNNILVASNNPSLADRGVRGMKRKRPIGLAAARKRQRISDERVSDDDDLPMSINEWFDMVQGDPLSLFCGPKHKVCVPFFGQGPGFRADNCPRALEVYREGLVRRGIFEEDAYHPAWEVRDLVGEDDDEDEAEDDGGEGAYAQRDNDGADYGKWATGEWYGQPKVPSYSLARDGSIASQYPLPSVDWFPDGTMEDGVLVNKYDTALVASEDVLATDVPAVETSEAPAPATKASLTPADTNAPTSSMEAKKLAALAAVAKMKAFKAVATSQKRRRDGDEDNEANVEEKTRLHKKACVAETVSQAAPRVENDSFESRTPSPPQADGPTPSSASSPKTAVTSPEQSAPAPPPVVPSAPQAAEVAQTLPVVPSEGEVVFLPMPSPPFGLRLTMDDLKARLQTCRDLKQHGDKDESKRQHRMLCQMLKQFGLDNLDPAARKKYYDRLPDGGPDWDPVD